MNSREHSIATWCKRFQIELSKLRDRMKAGELVVYEKTGDEEVNVTVASARKISDQILIAISSYSTEKTSPSKECGLRLPQQRQR